MTCTSTDPTNHQGDTCPIHEREWLTAWAYWDYNGQEFIEWTDREILLNIGKLMRFEAHAAEDVRVFHLARLERILVKAMDNGTRDRFAELPDWVERESKA
jgi:hypothetical protein